MRYSFHNKNFRASPWKNYNELRKAIRNKDLKLVEYLIKGGAPVNGLLTQYSDTDHETPIHLAVISRSPEIVKILLNNGADVNVTNAIEDTPLTLAAKIEDTEILDLLLSHQVEHHKNLYDGLSHLHIACMRNKLDVVKSLVSTDNGDSINKAVYDSSAFWPGFTSLHFAVYCGSTETVEYLLKIGVDMMAKDSKKRTPLHWADLRRNGKIIDLLLAAHKHEFKNPSGPDGLTHFHIACTRNDPSIVEHFLKLGENIDFQVSSKPRTSCYWREWKPIQLAMYHECPRVVELLLRFQVNCKVIHHHPDSLGFAFVTGNKALYELFTTNQIKCGDGPKLIENIPRFHLACIHNNVEDMELWLSTNTNNILSNLNASSWTGYTPLHLAVKHNAVEGTKLLLAYGANIMVQDPRGRTPLHVAFEQKNLEIMDSILETFTDETINVKDDVGLSFLHILCSTDRLATIESFLKKGVDINAQVGSESVYWAGFTPMHFACKFKKKDVIELLLKYNADFFIKNGSISDHFKLVFVEEPPSLSDFHKLFYNHLMTVFSTPSSQIKYSNDCKISPLHALALNRDADLEMLKRFLITHKDEINQTIDMPRSGNLHKCTPLHLALDMTNYDVAELMLKAKADPLMVNGAGSTPIELALSWGECEPPYISELFFPVGIPIDKLKPSHFVIACAAHFFEFVNYVLSSVDDPKLKKSFLECRTDLNQTPLHILSNQEIYDLEESSNRKLMMEGLLRSGADVDAKNYLLQTPLHLTDQEEVVLLLIDHGAEVNTQDVYGETPLHMVCKKSYRESFAKAMIALLESGADLNIEDRAGQTCLMLLNLLDLVDADSPLQNNFVIPLVKHMKSLRSMGLNMNKKNESIYQLLMASCINVFNVRNFGSECNNEIKSMMVENIDRYTTVHDILFKTSNDMTVHCENQVLQNIVESKSTKFPIYSSRIRLQMQKGRIRKPLLEKSKKSLILLIGRSLPPVCLERIFDYLGNGDLKNIIIGEDLRTDASRQSVTCSSWLVACLVIIATLLLLVNQ